MEIENDADNEAMRSFSRRPAPTRPAIIVRPRSRTTSRMSARTSSISTTTNLWAFRETAFLKNLDYIG
jgi:hypothetical protein